MTETKTEYQTKTAVDRREQKCSNINCQNVYGFETSDGYLAIGDLIVQFVRGYCVKCGREIRWFSNDGRMKRMLARRKKI